jgi:hypothetical protein
MTVFAAILKRAVDGTPNAVGGAFADRDGEMVDSYTNINRDEWAILTAHYGVVLAHLTAAFGTWHYGGPEYYIAEHRKLEIVVHAVELGYYALLALKPPGPLAIALDNLRAAASALRKEMA